MSYVLVLYLFIAVVQVIPLAFITVYLIYGPTVPFFTNRFDDWFNYILERTGFTRFEERDIGPEAMAFFSRFSVIAFIVHLVIISVISLAIIYDVPLPDVLNLIVGNGNQPRIMNDFFNVVMFTALNTIIQMLPSILFMMGFYYDLPLMLLPLEIFIPDWNNATAVNDTIY